MTKNEISSVFEQLAEEYTGLLKLDSNADLVMSIDLLSGNTWFAVNRARFEDSTDYVRVYSLYLSQNLYNHYWINDKYDKVYTRFIDKNYLLTFLRDKIAHNIEVINEFTEKHLIEEIEVI